MRKALCFIGFHGYEVTLGDPMAKCPHCGHLMVRGGMWEYAAAAAAQERSLWPEPTGASLFWIQYGDKL